MSGPAGSNEADRAVDLPVHATPTGQSTECVRPLAASSGAVAALSLGRDVIPFGRRVSGWRFGPFRLSCVRLTAADRVRPASEDEAEGRGDWTVAVRRDGAPVASRREETSGTLGDRVAVPDDGGTAIEDGLGPGEWLLLAFPESVGPKDSACPTGPLRGCGAGLLRDHILALERHLPTAGERDREAFAEATRALLPTCLAAEVAVDRRARSNALFALEARVDAVIRDNLSSALLDTARICRLAGVSRSALYRMFEGRGGVAAHVRALRLERVRADLADPALASEPIARIAERHGLFCTTSFNRAFRRAFGCTPGDVRAAAAARRDAPFRRDGEEVAEAMPVEAAASAERALARAAPPLAR